MKQLAMLFLGFGLCMGTAMAQQENSPVLQKNAAYTGAKANGKKYRVVYQLDSNEPKIIEKTIRNINNALTDPRLAGKLEVELVAFSGGTDAYLLSGKYLEPIKALAEKGVIVAQCSNTLRERKIDRNLLFDFIALIPSGNGELIIRQAEGWAVIKP
ncbi:DsrE family protein [Chitinophaga sp. NPDC101104]|uniref:DsrE family protein n=1 Tax=Chitinophaga sp. NPDC101104 TaxID=3390561 RepID=UPI003D023D21